MPALVIVNLFVWSQSDIVTRNWTLVTGYSSQPGTWSLHHIPPLWLHLEDLNTANIKQQKQK